MLRKRPTKIEECYITNAMKELACNFHKPLTDASDSISLFKPERAVCTNGCEARAEAGILEPISEFISGGIR